MEKEIIVPAQFADICPIADKDFHNEMSILLQEPSFRPVVEAVLPEYKYSVLARMLQGINSKHELQMKVMVPFVEKMLKQTTAGLTVSGREHLDKDTP